jgi:signal peptide peptidase SppA
MLYSSPWAILPEKLEEIAAFLALKAQGIKFSEEEIQERIGEPRAAANQPSTRGSVAVLPIYGVISNRINMGANISGGNSGTSVQKFTQQFRAAVDDPQVSAIVLEVDSPGGSVYGVHELSKEIHQARKQKRIVAVANAQMASAAYHLGSAADELVVTPSGEVGSIGVYLMHQDYSAAYEAEGIKNTFISAGKYKVEANPYQPLTDEAKAALQASVDEYYSMFVKSVARNRGVGVEDVRNGYGQGRMLTAKKAVDAGMADRVATLDEVLKGLGANSKAKNSGMRSESNEMRARRLRLLEI